MGLSSTMCIPAMALHHVLKQKGTLVQVRQQHVITCSLEGRFDTERTLTDAEMAASLQTAHNHRRGGAQVPTRKFADGRIGEVHHCGSLIKAVALATFSRRSRLVNTNSWNK